MMNEHNLNQGVKEKYDITLQTNKETDEQIRLRIRLFTWGFYVALGAGSILLLCAITIISYVVWCNELLILTKSFWHLPLMLILSGTSVLFATIKIASSFGQTKDKDKDKETTANTLTAETLKEHLSVIKEVIDLGKNNGKA